MTLPESFVPLFRNQWASRFSAATNSAVIKRQSGSSFSDVTGQTTPTYSTQYSGAAIVRPSTPAYSEYGEERTTQLRFMVLVPYDEADPLPGDLVDVTSTTDSRLNGNQLVVLAVGGDSYNTVRKLFCEEYQDA